MRGFLSEKISLTEFIKFPPISRHIILTAQRQTDFFSHRIIFGRSTYNFFRRRKFHLFSCVQNTHDCKSRVPIKPWLF